MSTDNEQPVKAEPVAWAYEELRFHGGWTITASVPRPREGSLVRNIRPLVFGDEPPPVAAKTVASEIDIARLLNIAHDNGAAGFVRQHQKLNPYKAVCLNKMHQAGMAEVVAAVEDMLKSAAPTPPAPDLPAVGAGEDLAALSAGATSEPTDKLRALMTQHSTPANWSNSQKAPQPVVTEEEIARVIGNAEMVNGDDLSPGCLSDWLPDGTPQILQQNLLSAARAVLTLFSREGKAQGK